MSPIKPIIACCLTVLLIFTSAGCKKKDCEKTNWKDGCACIEVYDPVCGCDGNTYANSCEAECQGITKYTDGKCN